MKPTGKRRSVFERVLSGEKQIKRDLGGKSDKMRGTWEAGKKEGGTKMEPWEFPSWLSRDES